MRSLTHDWNKLTFCSIEFSHIYYANIEVITVKNCIQIFYIWLMFCLVYFVIWNIRGMFNVKLLGFYVSIIFSVFFVHVEVKVFQLSYIQGDRTLYFVRYFLLFYLHIYVGVRVNPTFINGSGGQVIYRFKPLAIPYILVFRF